MEKSVNERVMQLKTYLHLGRNEFATKANISPSTVDSIQNGNTIYPKTISSIVESFNVNREWLLTGKGKMFNEGPKDPAPAVETNVWQDATYKSMSEQIAQLKEELKKAWAIASHFSGGKVNFLSALLETDPEQSGPIKLAA